MGYNPNIPHLQVGYNLGLPPSHVCFWCGPLTVTVTTRIITYLVGNPYKPSFPLLLGGGTTQVITYLLTIDPNFLGFNQCHLRLSKICEPGDLAPNITSRNQPEKTYTPEL